MVSHGDGWDTARPRARALGEPDRRAPLGRVPGRPRLPARVGFARHRAVPRLPFRRRGRLRPPRPRRADGRRVAASGHTREPRHPHRGAGSGRDRGRGREGSRPRLRSRKAPRAGGPRRAAPLHASVRDVLRVRRAGRRERAPDDARERARDAAARGRRRLRRRARARVHERAPRPRVAARPRGRGDVRGDGEARRAELARGRDPVLRSRGLDGPRAHAAERRILPPHQEPVDGDRRPRGASPRDRRQACRRRRYRVLPRRRPRFAFRRGRGRDSDGPRDPRTLCRGVRRRARHLVPDARRPALGTVDVHGPARPGWTSRRDRARRRRQRVRAHPGVSPRPTGRSSRRSSSSDCPATPPRRSASTPRRSATVPCPSCRMRATRRSLRRGRSPSRTSDRYSTRSSARTPYG